MDELTREQEEAVAATVGAIQRIAMAIVALPKEERAAQYDRCEDSSRRPSPNSASKVPWHMLG